MYRVGKKAGGGEDEGELGRRGKRVRGMLRLKTGRRVKLWSRKMMMRVIARTMMRWIHPAGLRYLDGSVGDAFGESIA
jgi:hypothetical protein